MNEEMLEVEIESSTSKNCEVGIPIGGWLILLGIGVTLNPFSLMIGIYTNHIMIFVRGQMAMLDAYIRMMVYFEFAMNSVALVLSIIVLFGYYSRKRWFTKMWYGLIGVLLATNIIDYVMLRNSLIGNPEVLTTLKGTILKLAITFAIWGIYLYRSERVKKTFVN